MVLRSTAPPRTSTVAAARQHIELRRVGHDDDGGRVRRQRVGDEGAHDRWRRRGARFGGIHGCGGN
uniref:Uncharacterized protein n=1 Tax=Arundo donax TaxID=35708 RepID=A0A0A8YGD4_ARUDO